MADIKIKVEGRIATNLTPEVKLVTKNDGYTVEFEFDETWSVSSLKTALFIANGHCIPVPFVGNICNVPMLVGVELLNVGVKSDDVLGLQTTTAAKVLCVLSADDLVVDEIPAPSQSVYDRIVEMINLGMIKGDKGDKGDKGEKGDAGAIKFITVVELPTENIDESAIYLVPIENPDGENRFTEYAYIDGKWETLGAISIQVDHSEYVKFTDYAEEDKAGVSFVGNKNYTGITINGNHMLELTNPSEYVITHPTLYNVAVTSRNLYRWIKQGIAYNEETFSSEEKASACGTIGAVEAIKESEITGNWFLYGTDENGNRKLYKVLASVGANFIPIRDGWGGLEVPAPQKNIHATNRGYVDGLIAELRAEIAALKGE